VEVALEQRGLDLGGERLARLAHVLAQAAEEAAPALLLLRLRLRGQRRAAVKNEEILPVSGHAVGQDRGDDRLDTDRAGCDSRRRAGAARGAGDRARGR